MSDQDVLNMPLKRFWHLVNLMDRVLAEEDLRTLGILGAQHGAETYKSTHDGLAKVVGKVYVVERQQSTEVQIDKKTGLDVNFDREGLQKLKLQSKAKVGETL